MSKLSLIGFLTSTLRTLVSISLCLNCKIFIYILSNAGIYVYDQVQKCLRKSNGMVQCRSEEVVEQKTSISQPLSCMLHIHRYGLKVETRELVHLSMNVEELTSTM